MKQMLNLFFLLKNIVHLGLSRELKRTKDTFQSFCADICFSVINVCLDASTGGNLRRQSRHLWWKVWTAIFWGTFFV